MGLRGEEIDLNARIFAVADAFDAITSDRVYRGARSYESAVDELGTGAGRHFDPQVVASFYRIPRGDWEALRRPTAPAADSRRAHAGRASAPRPGLSCPAR
jgi:HD-GYP domain-containing protein (c-di-GMP phosphodiesterase class II)